MKQMLSLIVLLALLERIDPATLTTDARVGVILSQDAEPYLQAFEGFKGYLRQRGVKTPPDVYLLHGDPVNATVSLERARQSHPRLLFTVGSLATRAAVSAIPDIPIVAGLIMNVDDLRHAPNATGVVLEFPVAMEFDWLQRALPGEKHVGVLFSPAQGGLRIEAAEAAARNAGITLYARKVASPKEIPDALESLANRVGVLWGTADPVVLTSATAQPILLFSFRNRVPLIGLSLPWVKAGALYALDRDYADIGAQCAELGLKVLEGIPPGSLPAGSPRKVVYSINLKTARQLKLKLPEAFIRGAQDLIE
jgi:putative ABC transport system substrate-binding protein